MENNKSLELKIADLQKQEKEIIKEWGNIVTNLNNEKERLSLDLHTTNRKFDRKNRDFIELKSSYEKLQKEYAFLSLEKLSLEQKYYYAIGENMPIIHDVIKSNEDYDKMIDNYNERISEMNGIIKKLREKLGRQTVPLTVIVDEIKKRAKMAGIEAAYQLFESFNSVLSDVNAWRSNKSELETFLMEERERAMKVFNVNVAKGALAQISEKSIINSNEPKLPE